MVRIMNAAKKLKTSIERYFTGEELILIMGVFKDKEYEDHTDSVSVSKSGCIR